MFESPIKSGIFEAQRRGNQADSDPRLQFEVAGRAEVGNSGRSDVYGIVYAISQSGRHKAVLGKQKAARRP